MYLMELKPDFISIYSFLDKSQQTNVEHKVIFYHISSSIMVLQSNTMGKVLNVPSSFGRICKSPSGFRGHLITNFPNVMVLLIINVL